MENIYYQSLTIAIIGFAVYLVAKAIFWLLKKLQIIRNDKESPHFKELSNLLIGLAAVLTAALGLYAYNNVKQSITIELIAEQVDSIKSENNNSKPNKKGVIISVNIKNTGIDSATINTASPKESLLKIYNVDYFQNNPEGLYSKKIYQPNYYLSIATLEDNDKQKPSEAVFSRTISRNESGSIDYYIELERHNTYYITILLTEENLHFGDPSDTNASQQKWFRSKYIHVN